MSRPADRPPPVRRAGPADAAGVVRLIGDVFREYGFVWDPAAEVPDLLAFADHYDERRGAFWVAEAGGRVVGSVGVHRVDRDTAELHRLYVDPAQRRRGLGQALVDAVRGWCTGAGIARLLLWSDTRFHQAHALYERLGFVRTAERELPGDVNQTREYRYDLDLAAGPRSPGDRGQM